MNKNVVKLTKSKIEPGEYKKWKIAFIFSSPKIFKKFRFIDFKSLFKLSFVLEILKKKLKECKETKK